MTLSKVLALPVVGAVIIALAAVLPGAAVEDRPSHQVTVLQSAFACPTIGDTTLATGRLASHEGARATAVSLPGKEPLADLTSVDSWNVGTSSGDAVLVNNSDPAGAGAVGFHAGVASAADGGGLAVGACPRVVQDAWYVGAGSAGKHFSTLILTNLSGSPAIADVFLWGEEGRIDAVDAEGIVLKPQETRRVSLEAIAAGEPELAVRVSSRRGALSVAMRDESTAVFRGTEPMSPTTGPARRQVISGVGGGAKGRKLLAVNPGTATARVKVEAFGDKGAFMPTGLDDIKVEAGSVRTIDLPDSAGDEPLALRLTSDQPLSASVRMAPTNKDFAYAVGSRPLAGSAIVPISLGGVTDGARLVLTAPATPSKVTATAYDDKMSPLGSVEIPVKPRSTVSYDLGKKGAFDRPIDDIAYVVVKPSGKIQGATIYTRDSGVSAVPLEAAPLKTLAPDVRPGH